MQFICQIALPTDLFGDLTTRMAYLFATDDYQHGYVTETWEPGGGENALILQPGGVWNGATLSFRAGPSIYRRECTGSEWVRTPCEFAVELAPGRDPEPGAWDSVDYEDAAAVDAYMTALFENKVGGSPVPTVNKPDFPDQTKWRLLLQLNSKGEDDDDPFFLNFATDGVGYAFVSEDGRSGQFMWSR